MKILKHPFVPNAIHILALFNLAVAQPLYELISGDADFLVVRDATYPEIITAVLVVSFLLPALLLFFEVAARWISERLQRIVHLFFVGALLGLILLRAFNLSLALSGIAIVTLAIVVAAILSYCYYSFAFLRSFFTWLGAPVLVIPFLFLFNSDVAKAVAAPPPITLKDNNVSVPVLLMIFDELPLTSLLNAEGDVDAVRYPNFAKLKADSIWFRNASSVSGETSRAVTAILTGMYPEKKRLTRFQDYPDNLFTLVGGTHEMKVIEPMTKLLPLSSLIKRKSFSDKVLLLISDLSAVYLNLVVPEDLGGWFPRVDAQWNDFWATMKRSTKYERFNVRLEQFQIFLDAISPSKEPRLYFMHSMMPHAPWLILPSGKTYEPEELHLDRDRSRRQTWRGDRWAVESDYMRHLLQVGYVDYMLGQLIQKLKDAGLYDKSLIAITADHGICFDVNQSRKARRHVTAENYACLLPVPLFIKYPGQKVGSINESNVQTIDILPTLADILKVRLPGHMDGISALNPAANQRAEKIAYSARYVPYNFPRIIDYMHVVQHKLSLFGNGKTLNWLMALPESTAIGKKTSEFPVKEANLEAELFGKNAYQNVNLDSRYVPSLISGQLFAIKDKSRNLLLAISVNGTIRAVTQTFTVGKDVQGFAAMVPEFSFSNGKNQIELFDMTPHSEELLRIHFRMRQ